MKRRSFLKHSALSAAALALPGNEVLGAGKKKTDYGPKVLLDFNPTQLPPEGWKIEGYAFGTRRPDPGKRQRAVTPSANQRQYQSGKMTSPEFVIEDDFLQVDCAGVYHPTLCTIRLVVDGEDVRACSPSQGEAFKKAGTIGEYWFDLRPLKGKKARVEVRDNHFNGWIEKVKIVSTSSKPRVGAHVITTVPRWLPDHYETTIKGDYLLLPVGPAVNTPLQEVAICINGREKLVTDFPLAFGSIPVEGYLPVYDLTGCQGKNLKVSYHSFSGYGPSGEPAKFLVQREIPGRVIADNKPAFHVHCRLGRLNDPNGLCYLNGVYHLFHQYTYNIRAKSWAHYVSTDLMHWRERPTGLFQDELGSMHSGSAAVDVMNTSGWQKGDIPPVIAAFTGSRGMGGNDKIQMQGIAYSTDGAGTFTKYEGNPVVGKSQVFAKGSDHARDPKIFWFSPTEGRRNPYARDGYWVMVLFEGTSHAIYTSKDLKKWQRHGGVEGFHECPELFPLAIDGDPNNVRWVMYGANGEYHIGTFDGKSYKPETAKKIKMNYGKPFYAAQTFNNTPVGPDGQPRRIQVGWQGSQISIATELKLKKTSLGLRVCVLPVREISNLYTRSENLDGARLLPDLANPLATFDSGLYDIDLVANLSTAKQLEFEIRGHKLVYDVESSMLTFGKSKVNLPVAKKLTLRIVVDNLSTDIFAGKDGIFHIPNMIPGGQKSKVLGVTAKNGVAIFERLRVHDLKSIW